MAHELLQGHQRHALRFIRDRLFVGPPCGRQPAAKINEILLGNIDAERLRLPMRETEEKGSQQPRLQFPSQRRPRARVGPG